MTLYNFFKIRAMQRQITILCKSDVVHFERVHDQIYSLRAEISLLDGTNIERVKRAEALEAKIKADEKQLQYLKSQIESLRCEIADTEK